MKELHAVVDLQFGSCGKGLLAGLLAKRIQPDIIITAWAPNSGHTYIDADGNKYVNIAMPNGIVECRENLKFVALGPGSVINPEQLLMEMERYAPWMDGAQLVIHEHAAVVTENHRSLEATYGFGIGSTMKGVGEAVIQKIQRHPNHMNIAGKSLIGTPLEPYVVCVEDYNHIIDESSVGIIEGAQGFSLSLNQGFYPYVTSRDCTIHQLLSDCAIPAFKYDATTPSKQLFVHGVCRSYPIRVANRFDADGNQIGTSGPGYWDQEELEWGEIGVEPELTTVTKLPRRVFSWSQEQIQQAVRMNAVDDVFFNFANYLKPDEVAHAITMIQEAGADVRWVGYGPSINDVREIR